ncbi:tctex1 domain-containing protein 2 [Lingula anatina]|uniref:Tctex1 domain-containing protein 2 n=1 Tax=Lingula anatina TaxID=7574 RepID=A0A1S3IIT0_LINAN|nr:tctex1 domain-containing protein 2 [Lingula anatina]XP_013398142.1 tctex1 domain-containing protein 2 [Lingula anatina]XP_013398143.1 tctex1 domain-containing protein 2 [Lingula anatina]XP_013398144.1 tctex1 domain-containing protein 2 [Lingula anatina]XP_013398145.1 tctex1 domain-containing protein 2 [Lingula anatina]XP_013398146.1 tctex1 domain-containing protein 2 [Lingula anatina]XP_013398147.1 tctex1 domain-containing protein 2 [Lingula anatina]XP_013398148.1 tctex1 domain-containing|eukprot:XP_013398141.1 tctex1 domain-containing protein 2 [Lingula anatina]
MSEYSRLTVENLAKIDTVPSQTHGRRQSVVTSTSHQSSELMQLRRASRFDGSGPQPGGRRLSTLSRGSLAGIHMMHRASRGDALLAARLPKNFQNTYKMTPDPGERFNASRVEKSISSLLASYLEGVQYNPITCAQLSQTLTEAVKGRVKDMNFPRYKFVCSVIVGQNTGQGLYVASRSIWDAGTDNYATAAYSNATLFAVAMVFATYFE